MAYSRDDIERVRAATNLVELVEAVTKVKKSGRSFTAICPFHQEKTPSMSVDPARGLYHCFGCGAGGDLFKFIQETQGLDFSESVEVLARRSGVTLTRDPDAARKRSERDLLIGAVATAEVFYAERLKTGADAGAARAYLRSRGYDANIVETFGLGYAPEEWDALVKHLREEGLSDSQMIAAGLATKGSGGRMRDWFRNRVLFPIHDLRGDAVGFGARLLEGDGPKYLNTPETKLYHKAQLLYGLDKAKAPITRSGHSIVVEGYTDVIAMHSAGLTQAVATCGTALGEDHFDLLRRFSDRIILAFDADQAGAGAAIRGDELSIPAELGLDLRVAEMPPGMDPADLIQAGEEAKIQSAVESARPLLQFRIEKEIVQFDLDEPEGRTRALRTVAALIARQPDELTRAEYSRFVARRLGIERASVDQAIGQALAKKRPSEATRSGRPSRSVSSGQTRAERELLRALANDPRGIESLGVDRELFADPANVAAFDLLAALPEGASVDSSALSEGTPAADLLRSLVLSARPLADPKEVVGQLRVLRIEDEIVELRRRLDGIDAEADRDAYSQAFSELIALEQAKRGER